MSYLNTIYNQTLHPESNSGHHFENLVNRYNLERISLTNYNKKEIKTIPKQDMIYD